MNQSQENSNTIFCSRRCPRINYITYLLDNKKMIQPAKCRRSSIDVSEFDSCGGTVWYKNLWKFSKTLGPQILDYVV